MSHPQFNVILMAVSHNHWLRLRSKALIWGCIWDTCKKDLLLILAQNSATHQKSVDDGI